MNHLLVLTRPELLNGFQLAGVEAWPAEDVQAAMRILSGWLATGEDCLMAVDESFMQQMDAPFVHRLENDEHALLIAIPAGEGLAGVVYQRNRIAEITRQVIGFHSVFKTEPIPEQPV